MKVKIGVMGSSGGDIPEHIKQKARELGRQIALHDCILLTGGCPGLPYEAVKGAKEAGGLTVGVSPALSLEEHINKYNSPIEGFDLLLYTGEGFMGREIPAIRSCDIVIIVGGRSGTLGEFAIAYDEGKLMGVLTGTGGITDEIPNIVKLIHKPTGSVIIYDDDPKRLVERLLDTLKTNPPRPLLREG